MDEIGNKIRTLGGTRVLKLILWDFANLTKNGKKKVSITVEQICENVSLCDAMVRKSLKKLQAQGWLSIQRKRSKNGDCYAPTEYTFHVPHDNHDN